MNIGLCFLEKYWKWFQNVRLRSRARRSPPNFLTDEHFNPSAAEQRSYSAGGGLDGVLKPTSNRGGNKQTAGVVLNCVILAAIDEFLRDRKFKTYDSGPLSVASCTDFTTNNKLRTTNVI